MHTLRSETPPHTWRKPDSARNVWWPNRNTSTYVEKTAAVITDGVLNWKHLHIRGENLGGVVTKHQRLETPPHTWRKPKSRRRSQCAVGNTSTYVEKTDGLQILIAVDQETPHTWRKLVRLCDY